MKADGVEDARNAAVDNKVGEEEWRGLYMGLRYESDRRYGEIAEQVVIHRPLMTPIAQATLDTMQQNAINARQAAQEKFDSATTCKKLADNAWLAGEMNRLRNPPVAIKNYNDAAKWYAEASLAWAQGIDKIKLRNRWMYEGFPPNNPNGHMVFVLNDPASYP